MFAKTISTTALGLVVCSSAFASEGIAQRADITLPLANQLIEATLKACHE